jgi:ribosomal protein L12E/L44/L45/RPP1/RPP2
MPRETHPEAWNFIAPAGVDQSSTEHSAAALSFPSSALASSSSSSSSSSNEAKKEEGKEEDKDKEEEEFRTAKGRGTFTFWHFSGLIGTPILLS